jgi:hypothetical protein
MVTCHQWQVVRLGYRLPHRCREELRMMFSRHISGAVRWQYVVSIRNVFRRYVSGPPDRSRETMERRHAHPGLLLRSFWCMRMDCTDGEAHETKLCPWVGTPITDDPVRNSIGDWGGIYMAKAGTGRYKRCGARGWSRVLKREARQTPLPMTRTIPTYCA